MTQKKVQYMGTQTKVVGQYPFVNPLITSKIKYGQIPSFATPQAGHTIENFPTFTVVNIGAIGPGNNATALLRQLFKIGERMQVVAAVHLLPILAITLGCDLAHSHAPFEDLSL